MKFLLLTPPLTQLNTPYPATTVLKGYLDNCGYEVAQADLGIELVLKIFNKDFLAQIFENTKTLKLKPNHKRIYANK